MSAAAPARTAHRFPTLGKRKFRREVSSGAHSFIPGLLLEENDNFYAICHFRRIRSCFSVQLGNSALPLVRQLRGLLFGLPVRLQAWGSGMRNGSSPRVGKRPPMVSIDGFDKGRRRRTFMPGQPVSRYIQSISRSLVRIAFRWITTGPFSQIEA